MLCFVWLGLAGDIIYIMGRVEKRHFLKFVAGFIGLVSLGLVGTLATGLYEVNQEETALVYEIFR